MQSNTTDEKDFLDNFLNDGYGYGDPEARLNDDRKITLLLAKQQSKLQEQQLKTQKYLNCLTLLLVIVGILNIVVLFKH